MVNTLRPYQKRAYDAVMDWVRSSTAPCLIEAATGSGKSYLVAALADSIHAISNKRVLCIAPSAELTLQNHEKFLLTGNPASIYSASIRKCLRHQVIFATPLSIKKKTISNISAIILDEAHGITPTIRRIIDNHRAANENLRVIGMTATPYRLGTGYIYAHDAEKRCAMQEAIKPYFAVKLCTISAQELLRDGYLTPPAIGQINADNYRAAGLQVNSRGKFDSADIDRVFVGHGRKTSGIIADIVTQSVDRRGVMVFASTIRHAHECMASLPPEKSAIVTGTTPKAERARIINAIKTMQIKYIVNVAVLTTGFDAPHIDVIALLRATESVGLLQQIVGRGLRVYPDKKDVLILDYAENIDRHCPDGDLFDPTIKTKRQKTEGEPLKVECPTCLYINEFTVRYNPDGYLTNKDGNWTDLEGVEIPSDPEKDYSPAMPGHYGRRCFGLVGKDLERCSHRWVFKTCPTCEADNDIAARYCCRCKGEIIDPNKKLIGDFRVKKKDAYQKQVDEVVAISEHETVTRKGDPMVRLEFTTQYRSFSIFLVPNARHPAARRNIAMYKEHRGNIETVTYQKSADTGFYEVHAYNEAKDGIPELA